MSRSFGARVGFKSCLEMYLTPTVLLVALVSAGCTVVNKKT